MYDLESISDSTIPGGTGHWVLGITCIPDVYWYDIDVYYMDSIPQVPGNSKIESRKTVLRKTV